MCHSCHWQKRSPIMALCDGNQEFVHCMAGLSASEARRRSGGGELASSMTKHPKDNSRKVGLPVGVKSIDKMTACASVNVSGIPTTFPRGLYLLRPAPVYRTLTGVVDHFGEFLELVELSELRPPPFCPSK
jgi:hypothetical protein